MDSGFFVTMSVARYPGARSPEEGATGATLSSDRYPNNK